MISSFLKGLLFMTEERKPEILFEGDSQFTHITIAEIDGIRTMYMGESAEEAETSISVSDPEAPVFEYPGMLFLSLALRPKARQIVMLGLGGGFIPRLCQRYLPEHRLTVAEIDPLVVELARVYFGFTQGGGVKVVVADGLDYLSQLQPRSVDFIWLDAFDGSYIPAHLATGKFLELTRLLLKDDGLLVQNLHQTRSFFYHNQLSLTHEIFTEPSLTLAGSRCCNTIVITPNGPKPIPRQRKELLRAARAFGPKIGPYDLLEEIDKLIPFPKPRRHLKEFLSLKNQL
jgi:spermidine synthase